MLFHAQPAFGRPAAVIIDERMWHKGILGIEDEEKWEVPLDSLIMDGTERASTAKPPAAGLRTTATGWGGR